MPNDPTDVPVDEDLDQPAIPALDELDLEAPEADALEQRQDVDPEDAAGEPSAELPLEAPDADAVEQRLSVPVDDYEE